MDWIPGAICTHEQDGVHKQSDFSDFEGQAGWYDGFWDDM